jgi:restriction system protein
MATKHDLPSFEDYIPPIVAALRARGGSATIEELEEGVAEIMVLPDDVRAVPHGDGPRTQFEYELAWVRTYLKKVGALENSERGVWRLTPLGAAMSEEELRAVPKRVAAERRLRRQQEADEKDPEGSDDGETSELSWKEHLLEVLLSMNSDAFERLCQRVLRESGFTKVEITGRSGDGGIDGVGVLRLNLLSFHVLF